MDLHLYILQFFLHCQPELLSLNVQFIPVSDSSKMV